MKNFLQIHPKDNVLVALRSLSKGDLLHYGDGEVLLKEKVPQKHKTNIHDLDAAAPIIMYGVLVGRAKKFIPAGSQLTTENVLHATAHYDTSQERCEWPAPNISTFHHRQFQGYYRSDGRVGTRNYWLVIPLVFCENRNLEVIREALVHKLGYTSRASDRFPIDALLRAAREGQSTTTLLATDIVSDTDLEVRERFFPNVDGIQFLPHDGGCGGIRQDAEVLCRLLAAYITHPNVGGATVLSLGCQNAQIEMLQTAIAELDPAFSKPLYLLNQQDSTSEADFLQTAIKQTFVGCVQINKLERKAAPLSQLNLGLECGGSDGFSGISANPMLGQVSDYLVALGGTAILSEFPELNGVEQELINRCVDKTTAEKFQHLMQEYQNAARAVGSDFSFNPSPGNIRDGLITDAMKSAGAAKKGGTSPVVAVLDYTEPANQPGLHLLCTPGNDVESTTGLAGSGANLIAFTTGLGTPTGNPISPTIKIASNSQLAAKMEDLIDFDAGQIISGSQTIEEAAQALLDLLIQTANGTYLTKAERLGQNDFIPWKRGISL